MILCLDWLPGQQDHNVDVQDLASQTVTGWQQTTGEQALMVDSLKR